LRERGGYALHEVRKKEYRELKCCTMGSLKRGGKGARRPLPQDKKIQRISNRDPHVPSRGERGPYQGGEEKPYEKRVHSAYQEGGVAKLSKLAVGGERLARVFRTGGKLDPRGRNEPKLKEDHADGPFMKNKRAPAKEVH